MAQKSKILEELRDQLANCMKCGNCMEVCPIYKEVKGESAVARGKLSLMEAVLNGDLDITEGFAKKMSLCISCRACTAKCPCGVKADQLILKAREAIVKARGLSPVKKAIFAVLRQRALFDLGLRLAAPFQGLAFKRLPGKLAAIARFPMPGLARRRVMAPFAHRPLRSEFPEVVRVPNPKMRVAFFTGCVINYIYTDIGRAVINVLKANNIEVVLPKFQHCCGTPVHVSGDVDSTKVLALHNIETFARIPADAIVTACASCGCAWKHEYPELFRDEPAMAKLARTLADKTYDISQFLVDVIPFRRDILGEVKAVVTMHDPCHAARGLKVTQQPREIVKAIPGVEFREMKEPARCCGSGGSFNLMYYELSRKINDRKLNDIASTGADMVVAGCGACRMHITDGLAQRGLPQEVWHPLQLLEWSYAAGRKKAAADATKAG